MRFRDIHIYLSDAWSPQARQAAIAARRAKSTGGTAKAGVGTRAQPKPAPKSVAARPKTAPKPAARTTAPKPVVRTTAKPVAKSTVRPQAKPTPKPTAAAKPTPAAKPKMVKPAAPKQAMVRPGKPTPSPQPLRPQPTQKPPVTRYNAGPRQTPASTSGFGHQIGSALRGTGELMEHLANSAHPGG
jgi:hypothetical protein